MLTLITLSLNPILLRRFYNFVFQFIVQMKMSFWFCDVLQMKEKTVLNGEGGNGGSCALICLIVITD